MKLFVKCGNDPCFVREKDISPRQHEQSRLRNCGVGDTSDGFWRERCQAFNTYVAVLQKWCIDEHRGNAYGCEYGSSERTPLCNATRLVVAKKGVA